MAKDYAKSKCFVKKNGQYEEITYEELQRRCREDESYMKRKFLPLHGMLMEVSEEEYIRFYRQRNRQKYLQRAAAANQEISFDMLTTEERNGEELLVDPLQDVQEHVETTVLTDKLRRCLPMLTRDEQILIKALYFQGFSEHEWSRKSKVPQRTINDRKRRILAKLKKFLENEK